MKPFHFSRIIRLGIVLTLHALAANLVAAAAAQASPDINDPAAQLASFQVAEGFEVSLFASEKDGVVNPIQMRFDARGRLWVIISTVYPQLEPGQAPNDQVLILEDTNGDGRCDKTTVFADGLMIPTGIEIGHGGAYLGHGTELLFLRDTNGDGKADERRVVLRGFGTADNHQNINSFLWGPAGELWMSQGLHTLSHVETPWGLAHMNQAGLWRLWPHRLLLQPFYGSGHEPQNPWGFAFTDWGEPIVIAGNNHSHIYPVPGLVSHRREAAPHLIWRNGRGRKSSGGDIVGTAHFPDEWQGALITGGYINNAIWALKIVEDGAGFALEDLPPLIVSSHRSFRPVDVKFGPDGALYICDWYNPIIGHYQASFRHPDRDKKHGRIWRVTAKGRPLTQAPQLHGAPLPQLLEALQSPDRWTRQFAKRALADLPAADVIPAVKQWTARAEVSEHTLKEVLGVLQSHEAVEPELLARLCRAQHPGARAYAASVVGAWAGRLSDPLALLRPLVQDEHPRVRLQAIVACTYVPDAEAMEVAAIAADFPTDKFIEYALGQAVFALKPHWLAPFKSGSLNLDQKVNRVSMLVRADGTRDTVEAVRDLLRSPDLPDASRETFLRTLAEVGDAEDLARILDLKDRPLQARLLPSLAIAGRIRQLRPSGDLEARLRPLIESSHSEVQAEALKLAGLWKLDPFRSRAEGIAQDTNADEELRRAAIEAVALYGGEEAGKVLLQAASDPRPRVASVAIVFLSAFDLPSAARRAADFFAQVDEGGVLHELFTALLQRQGAGTALAEALSSKRPGKAAAETGLAVMSASGRWHDGLASALNAAAGRESRRFQLGEGDLPGFIAEVRSKGDAKRGKEIYRRQELGCMACHAVNGEGGASGPDLSALGTAQPIDFIVGAILDPQQEVKEGYMSISVLTRDGEEYQGYEIRETNEELVLRDLLLGEPVRLRRDQIQEKVRSGSTMPSGLVDTLTREEFRDLVRYLSELGKP
jgi:putative heme-binding domain-containing protein